VRPSATLLEEVEIAIVWAAISDTLAKLVQRLKEGHFYQIVEGKFGEFEPTHLGSV
jgi:hypothetical protein